MLHLPWGSAALRVATGKVPGMKRHSAHQIDELAQRVLHNAVPPSWLVNEHYIDYGKDYLVEVGDHSGELTGSSFYIQLKGHKKAEVAADGARVRHSLESKYAKYYVDKVKDLPVFLVVVDVAKKKGWWLFLQEALAADELWRSQASVTLSLPVANDICDAKLLRQAVEEAKKWMRVRHPESIHDIVIAHKELIRRTDPRFDVEVSLKNDQPNFTLLPKEAVHLQLEFRGRPDAIREKVNRLFDKGALVAFEAGEVRITGSKLFERTEHVGCAMQIAARLEATQNIISADENGTELSRLNGIPGRFAGGQKEFWFEGELAASPLTIKFGPVAPDVGGCFNIKMDPRRWDGQRLLQLAYFDRIRHFFAALPMAASIKAECEDHGNVVFSAAMSLRDLPFAAPFARYLDTLAKGRRVCSRLNKNPIWTVREFNRDAQESFEELDAILFGVGLSKPMPNLRLTMSCLRKTLSPLLQTGKVGHSRIVSDVFYTFMGEKVGVGRLVHDFKDVLTELKGETPESRKLRSRAKEKSPTKLSRQRERKRTVDLLLLGTPTTLVSVRAANPEDG
jgi:hypothetical protein